MPIPIQILQSDADLIRSGSTNVTSREKFIEMLVNNMFFNIVDVSQEQCLGSGFASSER
jgi:hypothetical protein